MDAIKPQEDDEFMKLLQESMGSMLLQKTLEESQNTLADSDFQKSLPESQKTLKKQEKDFQSVISKTLSQIKDGNEAASAQIGGDGDAMDAMMKELEGMMNSGDFEDMFGGIMKELVSKELLAEPMLDLAQKVMEF